MMKEKYVREGFSQFNLLDNSMTSVIHKNSSDTLQLLLDKASVINTINQENLRQIQSQNDQD